MSKRLPGLPRIAVAALILFAAALAMLRPLCESWRAAPGMPAVGFAQGSTSMHSPAAHDGESSDVACCASGDMAAVAAMRDMDVGKGEASPLPAPPAIPVAIVVLSLFASSAFRRRPLARAPRPYHRRSARILR